MRSQDVVKQALLDLVRQYGTAIGKDPRRCEGLLKDVCGPYRREIRILTEAVREGVPAQLAAAIKSGEPLSLVVRRSIKQLDDMGHKIELAQWAVQVWARVLAKLSSPNSSADCSEIQQRYSYEVVKSDLYGEEVLIVPCLSCLTANRFKFARLDQRLICGRCKDVLFRGESFSVGLGDWTQLVLKSELPLILHCWAPWSSSCRNSKEICDAVAPQLEPGLRIFMLNTEAESELGARLDVRSIPTTIAMNAGREIERVVGSMNVPQLFRWSAIYRID